MSISAIVRGEVTLPYTGSGLPTGDESINVFHFAGIAGSEEDIFSAWQGPLEAFYNDTTSGQVNAVGKYLSAVLDRAAAEIKWYWPPTYDGAPTGPPHHVTSLSLPDPGETEDLPLEVALCLSYQGDTAPLTSVDDRTTPYPIRSRRGRIYIGPLGAGASGADSVSGYPLPAPQFMTDLSLAASALASNNSGASSWGVLSPKLGGVTAITHGYTDNAWDTQRRRGVPPSSRVPWTV